MSNLGGLAKIKSQYLVPNIWTGNKNEASDVEVNEDFEGERDESNLEQQETQGHEEPALKKLKINETHNDEDGEIQKSDPTSSSNNDVSAKKEKRFKPKGQNKNRPPPQKYCNEDKLCPGYLDGNPQSICTRIPNCPFLHDINKYLEIKTGKVDGDCFVYLTYGKCPRGLSCVFASSHIDSENRNKVNEELWAKMQSVFEETHKPLLDKDTQVKLRKHRFDFKDTEKVYCTQGVPPRGTKVVDNTGNDAASDKVSTSGAVTDEDVVAIRPGEVKKLDWKNKLYLSPLTTVGNLPFRRLCVEMGADITCSEMSLATSILQGNTNEFALHRRHPSEKFWGIQLCASNGQILAKAAVALAECGIDYDFVDLNMGCPLDPIYRQGAGSGLMCRTNKFHSMVKGMTTVLTSRGKPFTVKMRTGLKMDKNIAHSLIQFCRDNGVAACTLHGRSREQRYLKYADWNYIGECAKIANPMPLFGNGDIMSYEDYNEKKAISNVPGVMIGRGALIKPWIFQEIKEQRHIDLSSSERLELIRKYSNYGLDHWGSDSQGVATTRRFVLEWLSFYHRYIPYGILEEPPQRINHRPPKYVGRDEMETLLASQNSADWVKISEMFLGPVPDNFVFLPKHKANAWSNG